MHEHIWYFAIFCNMVYIMYDYDVDYFILLYITKYYYILLYFTLYYYILLNITKYYYILLYITIYYYILLYITIYYYILLYININLPTLAPFFLRRSASARHPLVSRPTLGRLDAWRGMVGVAKLLG